MKKLLVPNFTPCKQILRKLVRQDPGLEMSLRWKKIILL